MADNSTLMKVGLFGGAVCLAYKFGYLNFLLPATVATSTATTPASPPATAPPAAPTYPPLGLILKGMMEKSQAAGGSDCGDPPQVTYSNTGGLQIPNPDSVLAFAKWTQCRANGGGAAMLTMDDWNALAVASGAPNPMPDPLLAFPNMDRSTKMNVGQYWAGMVPLLAKQGLSGYLRNRRRG